MGYFMPHNRRQAGLVSGNPQDASVAHNLPPRHTPGNHLLAVDKVELPGLSILVLRQILFGKILLNRFLDASADPNNNLSIFPVRVHLMRFQKGVVFLETHRKHGAVGNQIQLFLSGDDNCAAVQQ
jgi:hypothetical protein